VRDDSDDDAEIDVARHDSDGDSDVEPVEKRKSKDKPKHAPVCALMHFRCLSGV
jgi:hypothetical protein